MKEANYTRHVCIICGRKRYEHSMKKVLGNSWVCTDKYHFQFCCDHEDIRIAEKISNDLKKLKILTSRYIIKR
jgi:hypothetical protein